MRWKHLGQLLVIGLGLALPAACVVAVFGNSAPSAVVVALVVVAALVVGLLIGLGTKVGKDALKNIRRDGM